MGINWFYLFTKARNECKCFVDKISVCFGSFIFFSLIFSSYLFSSISWYFYCIQFKCWISYFKAIVQAISCEIVSFERNSSGYGMQFQFTRLILFHREKFRVPRWLWQIELWIYLKKKTPQSPTWCSLFRHNVRLCTVDNVYFQFNYLHKMPKTSCNYSSFVAQENFQNITRTPIWALTDFSIYVLSFTEITFSVCRFRAIE